MLLVNRLYLLKELINFLLEFGLDSATIFSLAWSSICFFTARRSFSVLINLYECRDFICSLNAVIKSILVIALNA